MKKSAWSRLLALFLLAPAVILVHGDFAQTQVVGAQIGVDPLSILDVQIKPNVLIVLDTSGSMREPPDVVADSTPIGGDDPASKLYQAKDALKKVLSSNSQNFNFGFASYGLKNATKLLDKTAAGNYTGGGPITYVSSDAGAGTFMVATYAPFRGFNVYPAGCTGGAGCRRYLYAGELHDNRVFRYNAARVLQAGYPKTFLQAGLGTACPLPAVGLFPQDPDANADGLSDVARPCVRAESVDATGKLTASAVFFYTSGVWTEPNPGNKDVTGACSPVAPLAPVAGCTENNADAIKTAFLKPELPLDGTCGDIPCTLGSFVNAAAGPGGTNPAVDKSLNADALYGIMAAQQTPIAGMLATVRKEIGTYFPKRVSGQRNIVLLVTDGLESCSGDPVAEAATNYSPGGGNIETLVIGFGLSPAQIATLNGIAQAGSGGKLNAFSASNTAELVARLDEALQQTAGSGEFSDTQTVTESVFEFGGTAGIDPRDPDVRYSKTVPLLLQSTFEMPGFVGHLKAFRNDAGVSLKVWDAGDKLCRQITGFGSTNGVPPGEKTSRCNVATGAAGVHATAMGNGEWTFAQLTGGAWTAPDYVQTAGRLRRRIFTTTRNGVFPYAYTASNIGGASQTPSNAGPTVPLWPPSTTSPGVDPAPGGSSYDPGLLDSAFGIASLDFASLQATFGACRTGAGATPGDCTNTGKPALQLGAALKEARQMILAYAAGAEVVRVNGNPKRDAGGAILYRARSWMLAEGTLSGPALSAQPLQSNPGIGLPEYELYRDGPRKSGSPASFSAPAQVLDLGFGLRNPDLDATSTAATSKGNVALKPVMSVVYYGANDMLHAFRAGPQCAVVGSTTACPSGFDTGGEELWGFVPFDQLSKLRQLLVQGQDRANHKYMIATALRFTDVFVPGKFTDPNTTSRDGRWRRLLFFGRGIGGKHYTALDITNPGVFTQTAASTHAPLVLWNRGNPDTQDGTASGAANKFTNTPRYVLDSTGKPFALTSSDSNDQGVKDDVAYASMGQTWSVPALARATRATNYSHDFVLYVGSGYGTGAAGEGRSFYSIDPITGDILTRADVGSDSNAKIENAIVANPAVFNKYQLSFAQADKNNIGNPAKSVATRVYVGDLHGRVWKFPTDSPGTPVRLQALGADQPIAHALALINYDGGTGEKPHIFGETGDDRRVPGIGIVPPPPTFKVFGLEDNGAEGDTVADNATLLFSFDMPDRYRGTVQPATAFSGTGYARVFMVGTRFNPAIVTGTCKSSFDSILYIVSGQTGSGVYDLNGDGGVDDSDISTVLADKRVNAVSVAFGTVNVDQGLQAQIAPPPPAQPPQQGSSAAQQVFVQAVYPGGSTVCR